MKLVRGTAAPCICQVSGCRQGTPTDLSQNCPSLLLTETQWFLLWGEALLKDSNESQPRVVIDDFKLPETLRLEFKSQLHN